MLLDIDTNLSNAVMLSIVGAGSSAGKRGNVKFQFPPRIITDSKSGNWVETDQRGAEPVAAYATSGAREIKIEWTYIVGEQGGALGKPWSTSDIKNEVAGLRWYFMQHSQNGTLADLIVLFKMWKHGGSEPMSARLKSVSVSHGNTIVVPDGDTEMAYPLQTDVSVDLRLWSKGGASATGAALAAAASIGGGIGGIGGAAGSAGLGAGFGAIDEFKIDLPGPAKSSIDISWA